MTTDVPPPVAANILPHSIHGGVHYDLFSPGTVTFVLRAPQKPYVSLVGDFNHWDSRAHPLVTDGRGTWWVTLDHPGPTRYGYFVAIDQQSHTWVGDPYASELRWDEDNAWAFLPASQSEYGWSDGNWQTPALRDTVIYELNVRDFAGAWIDNHATFGTLERMLERLAYLAELGINAIELMPIQAFPGKSSWGYNPVFYFSIAQTYGDPVDLKRFVDRCHALGIAVILDVAFNHAWGDHPFYHYYPPMYGGKGDWLEDENPFFHHTPQAVNMWGGLDWDHFCQDTTRYFQDVIRFWLSEYHIDGFRFDWVCGVDYDTNDPMNPGFNPFHGISAICWAARQAKPDCLLIGEFWQLDGAHPDKSSAKLVRETDMDAVWNGEFHHVIDEVLNQRWQWERRDIHRAIGGYRDLGHAATSELINFTCSHDEVRPEHEIIFYSGRHIDLPPGKTLQAAALQKALLGLITLFTAPGVPMLYAGQEFGEDAPRTIDFLPLHWEKMERKPHANHLAVVRKLIQLRHEHPALRSDHIRFYANDFATEKIVRYDRWAVDDEKNSDFVAVAINFDSICRKTKLGVPEAGDWRNLLTGERIAVKDGEYVFELGAWSAMVIGKASSRS